MWKYFGGVWYALKGKYNRVPEDSVVVKRSTRKQEQSELNNLYATVDELLEAKDALRRKLRSERHDICILRSILAKLEDEWLSDPRPASTGMTDTMHLLLVELERFDGINFLTFNQLQEVLTNCVDKQQEYDKVRVLLKESKHGI